MYVETLAADSLGGRLAGTPGGAAAAELIAGWLEETGVVPMSGDSYFQTFYPEQAPELADFWSQLFGTSDVTPQRTGTLTGMLFDRLKGVEVRNVLGKIEGENPDEYVVVGAHYDHIGMRPDVKGDDKIFNGADDNASGVAGVLQIARAFAASGVRPQRTVIFALWDAEESGLVGSGYFSRTFEGMDKIRACFNLDMIGRDDDGEKGQLMLFSTDTLSYIRIAREDIAAWGMGILPVSFEDYRASASGRQIPVVKEGRIPGGSDHQSFHMAGVPVYFINTGIHADYHRPGDEADKIDLQKMTDISKMAYLTLYRLANPDAEIVYPVREEMPEADSVAIE